MSPRPISGARSLIKSSTLLRRKFALRMCVINHTTTWDDVRETLETVERLGRDALAGHAAS